MRPSAPPERTLGKTPVSVQPRLRRCVLMLLAPLLLLQSLGLVTSNAEASNQGQIPLARDNSIRNRETGVFNAYVAEDSRLRYSRRKKDVHVSGGGRLTGLLLVQEGVRNPTRLYYLRMRECQSEGCQSGRSEEFLFGSWQDELLLPAGQYSIYIIADGAEVRATLRLRGLSGVKEVRDVESVRASLTTRAGSAPGIYSDGHSFSFPDDGLSVAASWSKEAESFLGLAGSCLYKDEQPGTALAYAPGCELRGAVMEESVVYWGGDWPPQLSLVELAKGTWSHGTYLTGPPDREIAGLLFRVAF